MSGASDSGDGAAAKERERRYLALIGEFGASLWRLTSCHAASRSEREDLYQEIGLALWQALPAFRGECSERTFVYRIAHNRALTHRWRRRSNAAELDAAAHVHDPAPAPEHRLTQAEAREGLHRAIRALPLGQAQVVTLVLEGLSHEEIASVLGVTENVVAVRMHRARSELRTRLADGREPT